MPFPLRTSEVRTGRVSVSGDFKKVELMGDCKCGCGKQAGNGNFIAGHSQVLTARLVNEVGGLFSLQELVRSAKEYSSGEKCQEELLGTIQRLFSVKM